MSGILVRAGTIVSDGRSFAGDILIEGGTIVAVEKKIAAAPGRVIDAAGCHVFPGGVDPHVHLELETANGTSSDNFASGSRAALAGGTTTILDFVTPARGESLLAALAARKAAAAGSLCDYGLHMSVTAWDAKRLPELETCCLREGILSVKTYLAYKETIGLDDGEFLAVLDAGAPAELPGHGPRRERRDGLLPAGKIAGPGAGHGRQSPALPAGGGGGRRRAPGPAHGATGGRSPLRRPRLDPPGDRGGRRGAAGRAGGDRRVLPAVLASRRKPLPGRPRPPRPPSS